MNWTRARTWLGRHYVLAINLAAMAVALGCPVLGYFVGMAVARAVGLSLFKEAFEIALGVLIGGLLLFVLLTGLIGVLLDRSGIGARQIMRAVRWFPLSIGGLGVATLLALDLRLLLLGYVGSYAPLWKEFLSAAMRGLTLGMGASLVMAAALALGWALAVVVRHIQGQGEVEVTVEVDRLGRTIAPRTMSRPVWWMGRHPAPLVLVACVPAIVIGVVAPLVVLTESRGADATDLAWTAVFDLLPILLATLSAAMAGVTSYRCGRAARRVLHSLWLLPVLSAAIWLGIPWLCAVHYQFVRYWPRFLIGSLIMTAVLALAIVVGWALAEVRIRFLARRERSAGSEETAPAEVAAQSPSPFTETTP